jgi:hypothetical protein
MREKFADVVKAQNRLPKLEADFIQAEVGTVSLYFF